MRKLKVILFALFVLLVLFLSEMYDFKLFAEVLAIAHGFVGALLTTLFSIATLYGITYKGNKEDCKETFNKVVISLPTTWIYVYYSVLYYSFDYRTTAYMLAFTGISQFCLIETLENKQKS